MSKIIKVILVGDSNAGKSSLLFRILKDRPSDQSFPTVGVEVGTKSFFYENNNIHIQFWDTAGQQRFRSVCHQHYKGANAAILMFDLTNRRSFDSLPGWLVQIREHAHTPDMTICLFGNKVDCGGRAVTRQEATTFANINGIQVYQEISAQKGENVQQAINRMLDYFVERDQRVQGVNDRANVHLSSRENPAKKKCC